MAAIYADGKTGIYRIHFWYGGRQHQKSLKTTEEKKANSMRARIEETLHDMERGRISLPADGDLWEFLKTDGQRDRKLLVRSGATLTELFDWYFGSLPEGARATKTIKVQTIHANHFKRLIGSKKELNTMTGQVLQERYVNKRAKETFYGQPIRAQTIKKEIARQFSPAGSQFPEQMQRVLSNGDHSPTGTPNWYTAQALEGILCSLRSGYESGRLQPTESDIPAFLRLERILSRFHQVAKQLQKRRTGRDTLWIMDEYDVQDLLHSLLKIDFNDIRAEEWTPSCAGKSARMDFLIKREKIVVEAKQTREGLAEKELGDELLVDVARYRSHPDCQTLVCFIYDPGGRIGNPEGLKYDLEKASEEKPAVVVYICQH
jgi:hypothetical protein